MALFKMAVFGDFKLTTRLDVEYHLKKIANGENNICLLEQLVDIYHPTEIQRIYGDTGIQILLAQNVRSNHIDWTKIAYMDKSVIEKIKRNLLYYNDVLMTRSGANYGDVAPYKNKSSEIYACADILIIRPRNIRGGYLSTFLNTQQMTSVVKSGSYGLAQPHISPQFIKHIKVNRYSDYFENLIDNVVTKTYQLEIKSSHLYDIATSLFLEHIVIDAQKITSINVWTKQFNDVLSSFRLDPEFWHPQHARLSNIKTQTLRSIVAYKKGIEVGSNKYCNEGHKFIRVSDITTNGVEGTDTKYISKELYESLKMQFEPSVGEILLTKDASPGVATLVEEKIDCIVSSGVLRLLLIEKINPYYLEFVLNSQFVKKQIERYCAGSVIIHWKPSQIENTEIPRLAQDQEIEIATLIQKSHKLRRESKRLLEVAKTAVEIAIEESEEKAMQYLNENQPTSIEY